MFLHQHHKYTFSHSSLVKKKRQLIFTDFVTSWTLAINMHLYANFIIIQVSMTFFCICMHKYPKAYQVFLCNHLSSSLISLILQDLLLYLAVLSISVLLPCYLELMTSSTA